MITQILSVLFVNYINSCQTGLSHRVEPGFHVWGKLGGIPPSNFFSPIPPPIFLWGG